MNAVGLTGCASTTTRGHLRAPGWFGALTAALSVVGFVGLLLMTRWGIGTSPDSAGYLQAARSIVTTAGGVLLGGEGAGATALTHFAPLYSLLLSLGGLIGLDPYNWARWLNAALFGGNVLLASVLLRDALGGAVWLRIAGTVWMLMSVPILGVHVAMLSEAAFLFLTFLGLWQLAKYLDSSILRHLLLAGVSIGAAWLTRYAGVVSVLSGGMALLMFGSGRPGRRIRDAILFGVVGSAGMLAWMARNAIVVHSATGREFAFHPLERAHLWQALYTASGWLLIPQAAPNSVRFAIFGVLGVGAAAVLTALRRAALQPGEGARSQARISMPALVKVLALFVASYAAFLAFSISFFDANTPLDNRILSPVYVAGIVLSLWLFQGLCLALSARRALVAAAVAGLVAFMGAIVVQGTRLVAASHAGGWGLSATSWQASPTLDRVRRLPETVLIYSNVPELIYLHTGRTATAIPRPLSAMNRQPNPDFGPQMGALEHTLTSEPSVVVYFTGLSRGARGGNERDLMADLSLRVRDQLADGLVLCAAACPE